MAGTSWTLKPWGRTTCLYADDRCEFHLADVIAGGYSSWHFHTAKANRITSLGAVLLVTAWTADGPSVTVLRDGQHADLHAGVVHQFRCLESGRMWEHYSGSPCRLDDIVRLSENGIESNPAR